MTTSPTGSGPAAAQRTAGEDARLLLTELELALTKARAMSAGGAEQS